jgi:iron complex transport system permease protein
VGFVGLVAPHACRLVLGPRHRQLVPAAALTGALFVVIADLLARTLAAPAELPLGVLTALVGGPFFLALLRRAGQAYSW